jgi:hypothetical protein
MTLTFGSSGEAGGEFQLRIILTLVVLVKLDFHEHAIFARYILVSRCNHYDLRNKFVDLY